MSWSRPWAKEVRATHKQGLSWDSFEEVPGLGCMPTGWEVRQGREKSQRIT